MFFGALCMFLNHHGERRYFDTGKFQILFDSPSPEGDNGKAAVDIAFDNHLFVKIAGVGGLISDG